MLYDIVLPKEGTQSIILQSITFTNGGMRLRLANLRLAQRAFTTPYLKDILWKLYTHLPDSVKDTINGRSLRSIWSPEIDQNQDQVVRRDQDIDDMKTLMRYNNGRVVLLKTISYLQDRY